jgi:hypothetical protein
VLFGDPFVFVATESSRCRATASQPGEAGNRGGPYLCQVERVEPVGLRLLERHDLHAEGPARKVGAMAFKGVTLVEVGVLAGDPLGFGGGEALDALVGLEIVFDPASIPLRVDPHVGVRRIAIDVPPGPLDPSVPE